MISHGRAGGGGDRLNGVFPIATASCVGVYCGMAEYDRVKHLEMISKAIERMEKASYALKALSPGAVAVALVLVDKKVPAWLALMAAAVAVLIYWWLDASYLAREKAFRALYNMVRDDKLDTEPYIMEIRTLFGENSPWRCMWVSVVWLVHASVLLVIVVAFVALSLLPQPGMAM